MEDLVLVLDGVIQKLRRDFARQVVALDRQKWMAVEQKVMHWLDLRINFLPCSNKWSVIINYYYLQKETAVSRMQNYSLNFREIFGKQMCVLYFYSTPSHAKSYDRCRKTAKWRESNWEAIVRLLIAINCYMVFTLDNKKKWQYTNTKFKPKSNQI